jgi:hypothetical protein
VPISRGLSWIKWIPLTETFFLEVRQKSRVDGFGITWALPVRLEGPAGRWGVPVGVCELPVSSVSSGAPHWA